MTKKGLLTICVAAAVAGGVGTGSGTGTGWQNELRTIRLRLRDFQTGGTGIDLARIAAVRLEVGGTAGSTTGRFVIDDLQFTKE